MTGTEPQAEAAPRFRVGRIVLFACACACVLVAIGMLLFSSGTGKTRAEQVAAEVINTESKANVLLLLSYDDSNVTTPLERAGVLDVMRRSSVDVDVEYMDALNCPLGSAAHAAWTQMLTDKLAQHGHYAAVICADDEALGFVETNHETLFPNTPVVFFGVSDRAHAAEVAAKGYATGVTEESYYGNTMKLATQLVPHATGFTAIVDDTPSGVGDRAQFESAMAGFAGMNAQYLDASTMSRAELKQQVASANKDNIMFFLDASNDAAGNTYSLDESAFFISKAANQPVFRASIGGVGEGICGCGFVDLEQDGQRAAELAVQVLNGRQPSTIPVESVNSGGYVFDAKVMAEYDIPASKLPADTAVINRSGFVVGGYVIPGVLLTIGIILMLAFAVLTYRARANDARKYTEQRTTMEHSIYNDHLTDMPNMQWLAVFSDNQKSEEVRSIAEIDLINFSDINDTYGRHAGDEVIKAMATRLDDLDKDFLVRLNGAQFLLGFKSELVRGSGEMDLLEYLISQPVEVGDDSIDVEARMGVVNREDGMSIEEMIAGVDMAVREAKAMRVGHEVVFYDADLKHAMEDKIEITLRLKDAIANDGFVVYYQPQVNAETNEVTGYEALARLKDGSYPPTQFIPVAEMNGMVVDIDRIVTRKAVQQLATWKKRNKRMRPVSINYSPAQLKDEEYVDFLLGLLEEFEVSPAMVKIEITESLFINDAERADRLFERLEEAGISIELDDFGVGYTSVARVMSIPAEVVKIDKSLVDTYLVPGKEDVVANLVRMMHGMGKKVIVEGVETLEQYQLCCKIGCDMVQGFYFSKPLLPERAAQYKPAKDAA